MRFHLNTPRPHTLEDLRQSPQAAWLWDAARGRIVWANAAGVAAFEGQTVFDLVDRPFDLNEQGVKTLADLLMVLEPGENRAAQLQFPSVGQNDGVACTVGLHHLADGRRGVLVVAVPVAEPMVNVPADLSQAVLAHLPVPVLLVSADGLIASANDAASALLSLTAGQRLHDVFTQPLRAEALLRRLEQSELASVVEPLNSRVGLRTVKVTGSRFAAAPGTLVLLLDDVTDRRALESGALAAPLPDTALQAFDKLAQSLKHRLNDAATSPSAHPAADTAPPAAAPAVPVAEAPAPAARVAPPAPQAVPLPVRRSLENTGEAIIVGRDSAMIFATCAAAKTLGYESADELLSDNSLWSTLKAHAQRPFVMPLAHGAAKTMQVECNTIPWLNGPAEQFVVRAVKDLTPVQQTAPAATPAGAMLAPVPVAPVALSPAAVSPVPVAPTAPAVVQHHETVAPHAPAPDTRAAMDAEELKAMLDVASDGIIALDNDGSILTFSAGAEAIFGQSQVDVRGQKLADLFSADSRKAVRDYLAALNGPGLASVFNDGREVTASLKQGGEMPLFLTLGRLQSPHSRASFCAVVRDITQWKRTERDLREAKEAAEQTSRQKSDFLAHVSHELRTPLNAILGFSDVMRSERFGEIKNDKYRAYANDIHDSGAHLLSLVNDLLDLSKIEAGKMELDFTAVNLADVVEHAVRLTQEDAARQHIVLRTTVAKSLPRVVADLRALRQVLLNLTTNAIKYTDAGGQVFLSAQATDTGEILLRVKDTGIGMTSHQLEDALKPFARVATADRMRQGSGLGLPLTKALVEANRAEFSLSSVPGQGTEAVVRFPSTRVLAE